MATGRLSDPAASPFLPVRFEMQQSQDNRIWIYAQIGGWRTL